MAAQVVVPKPAQSPYEDSREAPARAFQRATAAFCRTLERAIRPFIPDDPSFSLDIQITIRRGKVKLTPSPQYRGEGWRDQSGG